MAGPNFRLIIDGVGESFPSEMTASHAVVAVCKWRSRDPDGFVLRRIADGTDVGQARALGDVLQQGDELELVPLG
jgi:hypothetical protein